MDFPGLISRVLQQAAMRAYGIEIEDARGMLETPPNPEMGDYAFPCFKLSKALRAAPPAIAEKLAAAAEGFPGKIAALGGYLNFTIDPALYAREAVSAALRPDYGGSDIGADKTVCLDYSSINIAKRFHIGHLSTTMIGHSLKRIHEFLGYRTVGINHLGDWGTQFGKLIAAYRRWGSREAIERDPMGELEALYVRFHDEAEKDPALEDEGRAWFKRIEDGDPEALELFTWFKTVTLAYAQTIYDELGIAFDSYAGESFYNDKMDRVVDELTDKGLLIKNQGAMIVDLEPYGMPPCLILKSDGATLYATRDIATALYRKDTYNFDKSLYIVAVHQALHFAQFFKVIELMGYEWAKDMVHVSYGMVSLEDGPLSSRKGRVVYLEDLLARAKEKALYIIEEKSPDLPDKQGVAAIVGVGAVVFSALYNNRIKDSVFSWDRMLSFDGENAPYVMYTHARCCSVLRKAQAGTAEAEPEWQALSVPQAMEAVRLLERFPEVILDAADRYEPSLIARYAVDLAQAYNRFYFEHRILDSSPGERAARLALTAAVRDTVARALYLLGITAPERM